MKCYLAEDIGFELIQSGVSFLSQRIDDDIAIISLFRDGLSVLGFYSSYDDTSLFRRFTGGPSYRGGSTIYIALLSRHVGSLREYVESLTSHLADVNLNFRGGYLEGEFRGVLGVTKLGDVGLAELFIESDDLEYFLDWLRHSYGLNNVDRGYDFTRFINVGWRYRGREWIGYRYGECPVEAVYRRVDGFYIKLGITFHDRYVKRGFLEGSFYASPPHAPFSLLAYLRGVHVDELIFYQFKFGWRGVDVYGLSRDALESLVDELYSKALSYTENL